jgi:hypothetical protein
VDNDRTSFIECLESGSETAGWRVDVDVDVDVSFSFSIEERRVTGQNGEEDLRALQVAR